MKYKLILCFLIISTIAAAQVTYRIPADSVKIFNRNGTGSELILENDTRNVKGFLFNKGNGVTEFKRMQKLNDTTFVFGIDTFTISKVAGSGSSLIFSNGIFESSGTVKLGGALTENTIIANDAYALTIGNSNSYRFTLFPSTSINRIGFNDDANKGLILDTGRAMMYSNTGNISRFYVNNFGITAETDQGFYLKNKPTFYYSNNTNAGAYTKTTFDTSDNSIVVMNKTTGLFQRYTGAWPAAVHIIDSGYFDGQFKAQVQAAQKGIKWDADDSLFSSHFMAKGYHEFIGFYTQPYNSNFRPFGNATGAAGSFTQSAKYLTLGTSSSATNGAGIAPVSSSAGTTAAYGNYLSTDYFVFETKIRIPTLNNGTERFLVAAGLGGGNVSANSNPTTICFLYDLDGTNPSSAAANYWQTLTANSSVRTYNQNHTQITIGANTWYKLKIVANTSTVFFFIDNVLVATHTTNIFNSSTAFSPYVRIIKTNSTNNRTVDVLYISMDQKYTTPL